MKSAEPTTARGGPLIMLALLLVAWTGGRALTWENPFEVGLPAVIESGAIFAESGRGSGNVPGVAEVDRSLPLLAASVRLDQRGWIMPARLSGDLGAAAQRPELTSLPPAEIRDRRPGPAVEFAHQLLWLQSLGAKLPPGDGARTVAILEPAKPAGVSPVALREGRSVGDDRWSFDAWGFWRDGSTATAVSQGRVPIYGASQVGAKLQYRLAPASRRDPTLFARAYRALVTHGENEAAAGVSARPLAALPVRVAAELRVTQTRFSTDLRPAIMATTELAPQTLPARFRLEAYGGAGYVGGKGATAFADGQVALLREVADISGPAETGARVSLGAGAWAGAQEDAHRVDVGPTMRLDLTLGTVPARLSVDWRERVGGDAAPGSGIAATLATRF